MGFEKRINAIRAVEAANAAKEKAAQRQRADQHRRRAEALMCEVAEGVDILRSKAERSAQLLDAAFEPMTVSWKARSGWSAGLRRRREMIGWKVETRTSWGVLGVRKSGGFAAREVLIPLQGPLQVSDRDILESIDDHVRAGLVEIAATDYEKRPTTVEIHADKTVRALLDHLAQHLALLD